MCSKIYEGASLPRLKNSNRKLFDLIPEIAPPIFNLLIILILIASIALTTLPSIFIKDSLVFPIQALFFCSISLVLWHFGYKTGKISPKDKKAYRNAFIFLFLPAMCFWYASVLTSFFAVDIATLSIYSLVVSLAIFSLAFLIWFKAIHIFSLEHLFAVGSFFCSSCRLETRSIFKFIRHPFLSVAVLISLGFSMLAINRYSVLCTAIIYASAYLWSIEEERELINRFGKRYTTYISQTNRFFPRFSVLPELFGFWRN